MECVLHDLLEKSAELYPEKTAVKYKGEAVSYRELNGSSSRLSLCLMENGVTLDSRVGVYIDKSIDAVIALLGILKSGACYVPLDPFSPPDRIKRIIEDCALQYLITSSNKTLQLKQLVQDKNELKYLFLTDIERKDWKEDFTGAKIVFKDEIAQEYTLPQRKLTIKSDNLAYILYTSGSTGAPKGVMITHRASLAFVNWAYDYIRVTPNDRLSSHAPFHFDLSVFDIYVAFKAGATLHIIPQGLSAFPKSLADFIENEKISIWYSVPSVLIQLLLHGGFDKRDLSALKKIIFAGEVFPIKYLRLLIKTIPSAEYFNFYGPTETNVCTYYQLRSVPKEDNSIPIGKPCLGQELFIVDENNNLVKDGDIGELYVSGPTLMEGYWNDPEETAKVLLENNFCRGGTKVYRTGDIVYRDAKGELNYHGRRDNMIKSRGYRIELGEIESTLLLHPEIKEAAVVAFADEEIGKRIKAAIVMKDHASLSENDIKLFCSEKLPFYMIPESIDFLEELPRTATGKVDRKKLEEEAML